MATLMAGVMATALATRRIPFTWRTLHLAYPSLGVPLTADLGVAGGQADRRPFDYRIELRILGGQVRRKVFTKGAASSPHKAAGPGTDRRLTRCRVVKGVLRCFADGTQTRQSRAWRLIALAPQRRKAAFVLSGLPRDLVGCGPRWDGRVLARAAQAASSKEMLAAISASV